VIQQFAGNNLLLRTNVMLNCNAVKCNDLIKKLYIIDWYKKKYLGHKIENLRYGK